LSKGERGVGERERRRIAWESSDENVVKRGDESAAMEGGKGSSNDIAVRSVW